MIRNDLQKINYVGIFATNASAMLLFFFLLFFLGEDRFKVYIFPLGTISAAMFVAVIFIPRFLDDIRGAIKAIAASIISETLVISLFFYLTGIRIGMLTLEKGTALDSITVALGLYTFIFAIFYVPGQFTRPS